MADLELNSIGNGDGNNYLLRDNSKIPLSGSNQISGSLIPSTDNSIDVGSSTKNIKMLYTKGITIDGKTIATDANNNMIFDSHIVDTIEEQGNGYIRYSNGLQICWGEITWQSDCSVPWGSLYETSIGTVSYPKSFVVTPSVSASGNIGFYASITEYIAKDPTMYTFCLCRPNLVTETLTCELRYIAIGRWK